MHTPNSKMQEPSLLNGAPAETLRELFASGQLTNPADPPLNLLDLIHTVACLNGADVPALGANAASVSALTEEIPTADHVVFVLVDGMGANLMAMLPEGAFLRQHLVRELQTLFPSATACAMTSLATGLWPSEHGVPGWWAYLPEYGLSSVSLPFQVRDTGETLEQRGLDAKALFPDRPRLMAAMRRDVMLMQPEAYWDSTFSRYFRDGGAGAGYASITRAIDAILSRIAHSAPPTYTMLYIDKLDHASHKWGFDHPEVRTYLYRLDKQLSQLARGLSVNGGRLIITADHGQMITQPQCRLPLYPDDPLLDLLRVPPTGEPRVPVFHVREGEAEPFEAMFQERFGEHFVLMPTAVAEAMRLVGPTELSPAARVHFGDFLAIAKGDATLRYYPPGTSPAHDHVGQHAGLSPQEMRIPLIVV